MVVAEGGGLAVDAAYEVPADLKRFEDVFEVVELADVGAGRINPVGGDDFDGVAETAGEGEGFVVYAEAVHAGDGKDAAGGFAGECLEAAAGVPDAGDDECLDDEVAEVAQQPLEGGLGDGLVGAGRVLAVAGADDHACALVKQGFHLVEVAHVGGVVGVGEEADFAFGGQHPFADSVAFAFVDGAVDPANTAVFSPLLALGKSHHLANRVVAGAVENNQHFPVVGLLAEVMVNGVERFANAPLLVIGGDDDR